MGQVMFTDYLVVAKADVDALNTSEALFRLSANTGLRPTTRRAKSPVATCRASTRPLLHPRPLAMTSSAEAGHGQERFRPPGIRAVWTCLQALHIENWAFCMLSGTIAGQRAGAVASSVGAPYTFEMPGGAGKTGAKFSGAATCT